MKRLILLAMSLLVAALLAVGLSSQARAGGNGAEVVREGGGICRTSDNTDAWFFSCNFQIVRDHPVPHGLGNPRGQQPASVEGYGRLGRFLFRDRG